MTNEQLKEVVRLARYNRTKYQQGNFHILCWLFGHKMGIATSVCTRCGTRKHQNALVELIDLHTLPSPGMPWKELNIATLELHEWIVVNE